LRIAFDEAAAYDVGKVSRLLAAAIRTMPHDLVLTGVQSDDLVNSATGGLVAGLLNLPHASVVTRVEVKGNGLEVACELEGGLQRLYSIALPAVLTIQFGANTPRYAPLPAIMKAARQPIKELSPAAFGFASWEAVPLPYTFAVRELSAPAARGEHLREVLRKAHCAVRSSDTRLLLSAHHVPNGTPLAPPLGGGFNVAAATSHPPRHRAGALTRATPPLKKERLKGEAARRI